MLIWALFVPWWMVNSARVYYFSAFGVDFCSIAFVIIFVGCR